MNFNLTPLLLVGKLFHDEVMDQLFSERQVVQYWLEAEKALALAQAQAGIIKEQDAKAIVAAATIANIDFEALWYETRNVGYPILPLVRMITAALPEGPNGRVHYGATTQDIMDTGLALQLKAALARLDQLLVAFGNQLEKLVETHPLTVLAARTHNQQAVPTTFGAKMAVYLAELTRHRQRLEQLKPRACLVSLFGAGGTSAALGEHAPALRQNMATILGLYTSEIPWHVARDGVAEFGLVCSLIAASCARFAREVIGLSRTEIGEIQEQFEHHRGASSTMPQKTNPIGSEAIIGMSSTAAALSSALFRAMEGEHERAAGEWQIEWQVLPQLASLGAGCLATAGEVARGLQVYPEIMHRNLQADNGLVMAEAYMMRLAPVMGRENAHDLVYKASLLVRQEGSQLEEVIRTLLPLPLVEKLAGNWPILPESYVGQPELVCTAALANWRNYKEKKREQL